MSTSIVTHFRQGVLGKSRLGGFESLRREAFGDGEAGAWFRPDDPKTQRVEYHSNSPTGQVTQIGQTVGLAFDQSEGLQDGSKLGPELRQNFEVSRSGSPTILATYDPVTGIGTANRESALDSSGVRCFGLTIGAWYRLDIEATNIGLSALDIRQATVTSTVLINTVTGRKVLYINLPATSLSISAGGTGVPNIRGLIIHSFCEVMGRNHGYQLTASKRPLFARVPARGRVNIHTHSENLGNAVWITSNASKASFPIGGSKFVPWKVTATGPAGQIRQIFFPIGPRYTATLAVRRDAQDGVSFLFRDDVTPVNYNTVATILSGPGSAVGFNVTGLSDTEWTIVQVTTTVDMNIGNSTSLRIYCNSNQSGGTIAGDNIVLSRMQMELGLSPTPYQRVGAGSYDVTEEGQPTLHGWLFDGVDDNLETNSIDMTTASRLAIVTGVRVLSNSLAKFVCEFGPNASTVGGFSMLTPNSSGVDNIGVRSRGSTFTLGLNADTFAPTPAPYTTLISATIRDDMNLHRLRLDGVQIQELSSAVMDVNYANEKLFIGARNGTNNFQNGYLFGLMFRGTATPTILSLLQKIETFIGKRTGKNL